MQRRFVLAAFGLVVALIGAVQVRWSAEAQTPAKSVPLPKHVTAFLQQHCIACHGPTKKKADLTLHQYLDEAGVLKDRKRWQAVVNMVFAGDMPPQERTRPKSEEVDAFLKTMNGIFETADRTAKRDPGRVTMRRLNRTEYNNTIRDLIGVDFQPAEDFPSDDVGYGFDNIGDVLTLSPLLMERYLAAAEAIMGRAIMVAEPKPATRHTHARFLEPAQNQDLRVRELVKDRLHTLTKLPMDGEYTLRVRMHGRPADRQNPRVVLSVDGWEMDDFEVTNTKPQEFSAKFNLPEGSSRFAVRLVNPGGTPPRAVFAEWFQVLGPTDPRPMSHRKLMACKPGTKDEKTREILERFASRAYRRPATKDEVDRLVKFTAETEKKGEKWEGSLALAMQAVLCSPKFLFRVELNQTPDAAEPHPIDDHQLASRLSYFLWSTIARGRGRRKSRRHQPQKRAGPPRPGPAPWAGTRAAGPRWRCCPPSRWGRWSGCQRRRHATTQKGGRRRRLSPSCRATPVPPPSPHGTAGHTCCAVRDAPPRPRALHPCAW